MLAKQSFARMPVPELELGNQTTRQAAGEYRLWFFNAPNYLAGSPDALLVPRDLAIRGRVLE